MVLYTRNRRRRKKHRREDVTVKMGSHGSASDETALISFGGIPYSGGGGSWKSEGPHGTDAGVSGSPNEGSVTLTTTTKMGIKGISWNVSGATNHHEIWVNADGTGAEWEMVAQFQGESSCNPLSCPVPSGENGASCQDTLRIDNPNGHQFISRSIVEITPTDTPTGGGTEPPPTPPRFEEGGESAAGSYVQQKTPIEVAIALRWKLKKIFFLLFASYQFPE
jgi:hypothetical protein